MNISSKSVLTILIFTYNSEKDIEECIHSAKQVTDSITLIDLESTDNSVQIAKKHGIQMYTHPFVNYVEPARDFGIKSVTSDWVLILDADERITHDLAKEIHAVLQHTEYTHYKIPRKEVFGRKKWLKHGGWWPNHQIRLIHVPSFQHWPTPIHSTPVINGELGYLQNPLLHYSQNDLSEIVGKTVRFEDLESDLLFKAGKNVSTLTFFRKFLAELYRRMFKWRGFMDGGVGIMESMYQAFSKTITYLYLYEKKNSRSV